MTKFEDLVGKTLIDIQVGTEVITWTTSENVVYKMHHYQACCESVYVEDVCGDVNNIIGSKVLFAYESTKSNNEDYKSQTWTFYNISTIKGSLTIRWLGESNGYYSERVDFDQVQ